MAQKVFVSYKYGDSDVAPIDGYYGRDATARKYVDAFIRIAEDKGIIVYKGEMDGEDLSDFSDDTIWNKLKERIFDSSLTIVFISPKMKEHNKSEDVQWIPQEISYSLREVSRDGRTSHANALLFVLLPDSSYSFYYKGFMDQFRIIRENENNGYAEVVRWDSFLENPQLFFDRANARKIKVDPVKKV